MNPNYPQQQEIYKTSDLEELNQKIQNRFIRDVVKPYSNSIKKRAQIPTRYRIPKSSEFFTPGNNLKTIISPEVPLEPYQPVMYENQPRQQRRVLNHNLNPYVENFKQDVKFTPLRSPTPSSSPTMLPSMSPTVYPLNMSPPPPIQIVKEIVIDCRQVHKHSSDCPVCSKIYRSNYSIFMVIIVILVLIILFLSKKCMNI